MILLKSHKRESRFDIKKTAISLLITASAAGLSAHAQSSQMTTLFDRSTKLLAHIDTVCDTLECHNLVSTIQHHIVDGRALESVSTLGQAENVQAKKLWHQQFDAYLIDLQLEMYAVAERQSQTTTPSQSSLKLPTPGPCLRTVAAMNCDQTFAAATAICGLYLAAPVAGEALAAACEVAAVYAYDKCVQTQKPAPQS